MSSNHRGRYRLNLQRCVRDYIFLYNLISHSRSCIDADLLGADVGPDPNEIVSKSLSSPESVKVC